MALFTGRGLGKTPRGGDPLYRQGFRQDPRTVTLFTCRGLGRTPGMVTLFTCRGLGRTPGMVTLFTCRGLGRTPGVVALFTCRGLGRTRRGGGALHRQGFRQDPHGRWRSSQAGV